MSGSRSMAYNNQLRAFPHKVNLPASIRLPKNFQPVGVSKKGSFRAAATRSRAPLVGMERATPYTARCCKHTVSWSKILAPYLH